MNQNTQYPILSFSEEEKGTNMIKVYVQDSYMYVSAKNTKWINYPISINRTYLSTNNNKKSPYEIHTTS